VTNIIHHAKKEGVLLMTLIRAIWNRSAQQQLRGSVAVFAEQFFGIETAILPALYNIPSYYIGMIF